MITKGRVWMEADHARSSAVTWTTIQPDKAFAYISDFSRHHEWAMDKISITPLTAGHVSLGSKYRAVGTQAGKDWPSDLEVTGYEPPSRFEFTASGGPLDAPIGDPHRHEFVVKPENGGSTIELRRMDPKPPNWSTLQWRLLGPLALRVSLGRRVQTLENLRTQLERQLNQPSAT